MVVGDLVGSGASQEQAIVGETPNLAARLQGIAQPNHVVIAESTRRLVGSMFELVDLKPQHLKGITGPIRAWAALHSSSIESRFDALHAGGLTELIGRDEELELLLRRWSKARSGEGQAVCISGEAGIGKSRLTAALLEAVSQEPHTRLRYFCSPQHTDSALHPIMSQMERAAQFAPNDNVQVKLDKLDTILTRSSTSKQDSALLVDMLSLPNDGRHPILNLSAQQRRESTLDALVAQVEALSRSNPVLMIFEDAHWIDPTSLEALGRTIDRLRALRLLLIVTHRPEFEPPWIGRSYVAAINLNRLGEREIVALIDRVTGNQLLAASIRQDIVERTDGIPRSGLPPQPRPRPTRIKVPPAARARRRSRKVSEVVEILHRIDTHREALGSAADRLQRVLDGLPRAQCRAYAKFINAGGVTAKDFERFLAGKFRYRSVRIRAHLRLVSDRGPATRAKRSNGDDNAA